MILDNCGQYLKILDNIEQHWQALYIAGKDERQTHLTRLSRGCPSGFQKNKRTCRGEFLFCKTLIYEFHPPLLLSLCQHPHSPPADSPCGIDPGATWKLLSSIVCNSILDLLVVASCAAMS